MNSYYIFQNVKCGISETELNSVNCRNVGLTNFFLTKRMVLV